MHTKNKDLKLIINLHRSPLLVDAVIAVTKSRFTSVDYAKEMQKNESTSFRFDNGDIQGWDLTDEYRRNCGDYTFLDAATEFGKLVALLEKLEPKVIYDLADPQSVGKATHDGRVKEDGSGIHVGCSFVSRAKVKECYEALFGEVA